MQIEEKPISGSDQKVQEYIARIKAGESKESIMQGLSPSFVAGIETGLRPSEKAPGSSKDNAQEVGVPPQYAGLDSETLEFIWTIPEYRNPEKTRQENDRKQKVIIALREKEAGKVEAERRKLDDAVKLEQVRGELGVGSAEELAQKQKELDLFLGRNEEEGGKNHLVSGLVKYVSIGRKQVVVDLYKNLLDHIQEPESRKNLVSGLFQDIYNKYRIAEYPTDPREEQTWEQSLKNAKVEVNNKKNEWMYRGVFPKNGEETITRGSFNVNVTPELIDALDDMIAQGKIKANYKFGQPGTSASPTERHDSISIYFLEQPTEEALQELIVATKPYVRGDNLLGQKISDGFFMSEIGSIETPHIESFIEEMRSKDSAFAEAVKGYVSPRAGSGSLLKMSEAQFYAVKDVARAFGYEISYSKEKGFEVKA